ncbi:MAG: HAMP domain-containing histidine kinase [Candidatus Eremiobacteraeota bacterium]|nr:HAMP domain-containing histidine kinase [Candidatus Eremiobacteraeota bacterium]
MLATIGHELRTPLSSIRGYLETLLDGELDPSTARRFLETARRETLRLGRLVDGMLEFSPLHLSNGSGRGACDAVEQIRATIEMLAPMAAARQVALHAKLPVAAFARIDGDSCVHAVRNLVENAIKHGSESGTVVVSCAYEGPFIAIVVDDDGHGVAPAIRDAIFAMGARGEDARARSGRGIGLSVVKAIADRAGGDICVKASTLGGARFVLRFWRDNLPIAS